MLSNSLAGQEGINYFSSAYSSFQSLSIAKEIAAGRFTPFSEQIRSSFSMIPGANRTVIFLPSAIKPPPRHDTIFLTSCQCRNNGNLPLSVTCHLSPMGGCRSTPPFFSAETTLVRALGSISGAHPFGAVCGVGPSCSRAWGPLRFAPGFVGPTGLLGGRRRRPCRRRPVAPPPSPSGRSACRGVALRGRGFGFESGSLGNLDTTSNPTADALCDRVRVSGVVRSLRSL